ncbi:hypothetical protein M0P65_00770 [Candidatus Gracilibacteria bacterium]|nr:hypothetical protein [Candidatus Gracilibacteria bacterium]
MSFLNKVFFSVILIVTIYILAIFFTPTQADIIGDKLGILGFNLSVRSLKGGVDNVSDQLLQLKSSEEVIGSARDAVNKANEQINNTKNIINQKIEQTDKTIESGQKLIETTKEFKKNISDLSSFSGATGSGITDSGAMSTGTIQ